MLWQPAIPDSYLALSDDELAARITARRRELGDDLLILGHHYQQDDVIRHADLIGDSLKLSQLAAAEARRRETKFIIFCGVHFMAETADILTDDDVCVILPDLSAGCSMADMADYDDAMDAWEEIHRVLQVKPRVPWSERRRSEGHATQPATWPSADASDHGTHARSFPYKVIPITYVNSSAAVKAFVGANGGACCTSSNAKRVFEWALAGGDEETHGQNARATDRDARATDDDIKILFLPDQHLGRNTASSFGLLTEVDEAAGRGASETRLWNPKKELGGLTQEQIREAKVLLWAGHCSVHKLFRPEHVDEVRAEYKDRGGINVLVHPECCKEVVDKSDYSGSTEYIIRTIEGAAPGSNWAIGTEVHLVNRLARQAAARGVNVRILSECQCLCTTMYRIDPQHLLWALDNLAEGRVVNEIRVHPEAKSLARLALDRMLALVGERQAAPALVD